MQLRYKIRGSVIAVGYLRVGLIITMSSLEQMVGLLPVEVPSDFFRFLHSVDFPEVEREATFIVKVITVLMACLLSRRARATTFVVCDGAYEAEGNNIYSELDLMGAEYGDLITSAPYLHLVTLTLVHHRTVARWEGPKFWP